MNVVAITGGAGNLGRTVAPILATRGYLVRLFDLPEADWSFVDGQSHLEVVQGDLRDRRALTEVCHEADWVVHLAAIMPPLSETNPALAQAVNIEGTRTVLDAMWPKAALVFASSVATYGLAQNEIVSTGYPQNPIDFYGKTKVQNEHDIFASGRAATVLRISGISVPALLEIPRPWFFARDQRVEFVHLQDAAYAVANCIGNAQALGGVWQVAGGASWRTTGQGYAEAVCRAFDIAPESAVYLEQPNWPTWYDTADSQALLNYQQHTLHDFIAQLKVIYQEAIG